MRKAGLAVDVSLVGPGYGTVASNLDSALAAKSKPSAIFAASNLVALAVLHELQGRGISIPRDVGLLCFDDFSAATLVSPRVTVIQQPVAEIGRRAAAMLLKRLETGKGVGDHPAEQVVLSNQASPPRFEQRNGAARFRTERMTRFLAERTQVGGRYGSNPPIWLFVADESNPRTSV